MIAALDVLPSDTDTTDARIFRPNEPQPQPELPKGIDFLWLELTGKCNLQCIHCYAESGPHLSTANETMTFEDWKRVLVDAFSLGCRNVQLIGGEPTIYPHLVELIAVARSIGYAFIEVFTNGTRFSQRLKEALKDFNVALAFSVYSLRQDIHEAVTLRPGSLDKTIDSIRWTVAAQLPVRVGIIDTQINSDTIEDTRSFLKELGVGSVSVDRVRGVGRGAQSKKSPTSQFDELCGECWKGKLCVTSSGEAFPCVFSRFCSVGDVRNGLASILNTDELATFRSTAMDRVHSQQAQCYPNRTCSPATSCQPEYCNPNYDVCNPKCAPHTCGPNCNPSHGGGNCEPTCKPSYRPFGESR